MRVGLLTTEGGLTTPVGRSVLGGVEGGTTGAGVGSIVDGGSVVGSVVGGVVVVIGIAVGRDDGNGAVGGKNDTTSVGALVLLLLGTCEVATTDGDGDPIWLL